MPAEYGLPVQPSVSQRAMEARKYSEFLVQIEAIAFGKLFVTGICREVLRKFFLFLGRRLDVVLDFAVERRSKNNSRPVSSLKPG